MASGSEKPHFPPGYLEADHSNQLLAANTVILAFATILLVLRLYARSLKNVKWGWDDILLPPAWILLVGTSVTGYLAVSKGGAGRHVEAVIADNPRTLVTRGKIIFALSWFSAISNAFSRISVVLLYLRVFTTKLSRASSWAVLTYLVCFTLAQIIAGVLECKPLSHFWWQGIPGGVKGTCFDLFLYYKINGILNIVGDVAIMILPIPTIWILQTSTARRVGIALVFLSGSLGLIASCIRTASFFTDAKRSLEDPTWSDVKLSAWTIVESGMYLSAACLIGLRPLYRLLPAWVKKHTTKTHSFSTRRSARSGTVRTNDQDSIRNFIRSGGDKTELRSFDQDLEFGHSGSFGSRDIRVDSEVRVTSTNGDKVFYPKYHS